jgi:hypothetical protein
MDKVRRLTNNRMLKRVLYLLAFLSVISAETSLAQQTTQPKVEPVELKDLIRRAGIKLNEYRTGFKDITAEEEQRVEEYDKQGKLEKERRIASDLIIYQSQQDPTQMVEYRDVKSVDGVAIKKREARLVSLLNKSAKADLVEKELERINRESRRYDLNYSFYGMTLNQGLLLYENVRESFQFKLAGREQVNGHDAIVIEYRQVSPNPDIAMKFSSLPSELKGAETRYHGRLWLDAATAQLRREVREMTLEHPSLSRPLILMRYDLEYADSRFGFLTPRRIVISTYNRGRTGADKKPELVLGGKITFEYGAFTRFSVDKPDASITPPGKP